MSRISKPIEHENMSEKGFIKNPNTMYGEGLADKKGLFINKGLLINKACS